MPKDVVEFATYYRPEYDLRTRLTTKLGVMHCTDCTCRVNPHLPASCSMDGAPPYVIVSPSPQLEPATHRTLAAVLPEYAHGAVPVLGWVSCPSGPGRPASSAVVACRHQFWAQLRALQFPPLVIVDDLGYWRDDLSMMTMQGYTGVWGEHADDMNEWGVPPGVWCFVLGDVSMVASDRGSMARLQDCAERLRLAVATEPDHDIDDNITTTVDSLGVATVSDQVGFARWLRNKCVLCGTVNGINYDCDAVAYCDAHFQEHGVDWKAGRRKWIGEVI